MGLTPPRARRRLLLTAIVLTLLSLAATTAPVALAKWGGGNGQGNGHAGGGGQGNGHAGGGGQGNGHPAGGAAAGGPGNGGGNGHGNGGGNGHGNGGARGNGGGRQSGGSSYAAAPTSGGTQTTGGNTGRGRGNGNGNGRGHGNGNRNGAVQGTNRSSTTSSGTTGGAQPSSSGGSTAPGQATAASATPSTTTRRRTTTRRAATLRKRAAARRKAASRGRAVARARRARTTARRTLSAGQAAALRPVARPTPLATAPARPGARPGDRGRTADKPSGPKRDRTTTVVRTLKSVVHVIPAFVKAIIAALALALLIASVAWFILARNARFLRRQREKLVGEIGVLQGALLPTVAPELSRLEASVAYRPAEGLAAGGDFYDAFPLERGGVGIVVGDVAGHGKDALMHTALLRYTMRAYLEAGLEPRAALQVAGRVLDRGFDTLATVVLAVYDPERHVLRYATAGHPPPVFLGEADHVPVTRASSPPIGAMLPTGLRQTTVSLPAGSAACFFTDGLIEARRDGDLIGRLGLVEIIRELGPHATASQLLDKVAAAADHVGDDMAACMFRVQDGSSAEDSPPRLEEIELLKDDPVAPILGPFLTACGVAPERIERRIATAERIVAAAGGAIVSVSFPPAGPARVTVDPANVESLAAAQAVRAAI